MNVSEFIGHLGNRKTIKHHVKWMNECGSCENLSTWHRIASTGWSEKEASLCNTCNGIRFLQNGWDHNNCLVCLGKIYIAKHGGRQTRVCALKMHRNTFISLVLFPLNPFIYLLFFPFSFSVWAAFHFLIRFSLFFMRHCKRQKILAAATKTITNYYLPECLFNTPWFESYMSKNVPSYQYKNMDFTLRLDFYNNNNNNFSTDAKKKRKNTHTHT